jgi:hypothetical protein
MKSYQFGVIIDESPQNEADPDCFRFYHSRSLLRGLTRG